MGNSIEGKKDAFNMHVNFIGINLQTFYNKLKESNTLKNIIKFWDIDPLQNIYLMEQINNYFDILDKYKADENNKDKNIRECLILKVNNIFDPEVNTILQRINNLSERHYMPLVLILSVEFLEKKIKIDKEKYDQIDPRLIFVEQYTEDPDIIEEKIVPILLRFCSIHNELGDIFNLESGKEEHNFDLIEKAFPFNLNIVCIGRFGQGKSTGVNQILQEYKAKESCKGCSQTKNITFYQVKNQPIRILDVPGFENEKTVNDAIAKFKLFGQKLNKLKDNIHIILYFLSFTETRSFMELEYPIIEEITKHKSSKLIYVITHSKNNIKQKTKAKVFDRINSGIQGITKNKPISTEMFKATENNVVFVNFHYDEEFDIEPFGKKELFKKIHDFFVESEDYKQYKKKLTKEEIEKRALKLRGQAQRELLPNKIWGGVVGIIPFVDLALQKFVIKKNAIKKVGEIFGFDAKFIDEDNEREKKLKEKNKNNIGYNTPRLNKNDKGVTVDGNDLIEENDEYMIGKTVKYSAETGSYVSGGIAGGVAVANSIKAANYAAEAAQFGANAAQLTTKAAQLAEQANNINVFSKVWYAISGTTSSAAKAAQIAASNAAAAESAAQTALVQSTAVAGTSTLCKFASVGLFGIGIVLGVGCGTYFTYKFCEELLDKFVDYYKQNSDKIKNSYETAAEYFVRN